jgi:hypothetical protein
MVNGAKENDHAFSIESDIVKLNHAGERLMTEGHRGTDRDRFCRRLAGDKGTRREPEDKLERGRT